MTVEPVLVAHAHLLLVDDDKNICKTLEVALSARGYNVTVSHGVDEAVKHLFQKDFDMIVTDYKMGEKTGLDLISEAKKIQSDCLVIVMTAFSSIENAIQVLKEGAFDYLQKPFTQNQLLHCLEKASKFISLSRENLAFKKITIRRDFFTGYSSKNISKLEEFISAVAPTDAPILLSGESGTGKNELASLIHELSARRKNSLVELCCTTLTETLIESELFGHVKGSFTGATKDKTGKLEIASRGTLFLDEIGDLPLAGQAKLLRFLQEKAFEKVGSNKTIIADARIIAATNRNLKQLVVQGKFREDLYYRLNTLECTLAPLRTRKEDLPIYITRITSELRNKYECLSAWEMPDEIQERLLMYDWPGNIRELKNVLERLIILSRSRQPKIDDLPEELCLNLASRTEAPDHSSSLEAVEKEHIRRVLASESNFEAASRKLGISSVTLWKKRKLYGMI